MGNLGFLFEIDDEFYEKNSSFVDKIKLSSRKFVVFVSRDDVKGNYVVSRSNFKSFECDFLFLDKDDKFSSFLTFENSLFKAAKIQVSNKRAVDYVNLTFWLEPKEYKDAYNLLLIRVINNDLSSEILSRVFELYHLLHKKM
ncbi:MAG: hypothetical protein PF569_04085 [Candidatus Woesearchaeota archaeon]|jgi:hypothetical protein|nr:hypothetical protein [Candidatus Woesearchaeota archaeon]